MTTYKMKVDLPEVLKTLVQEIQGVGAVTGITDQHLLVEIEGEDEFAMGEATTELRHTLLALTCEHLGVSRPTPKERT